MAETAASSKAPFDLYRLAFFLAALTAIRAIGFPPDIWGGDFSHHANELIFGFMLVQLFGFMLKALPRWIGRPVLGNCPTCSLLAAQALVFAIGCMDLHLGAQLRSIVGLIGVIALSINAIRARSRRTYPLLALAIAHAGTGIIAAYDLWAGATMLGFCLILAICFEVGNRIFPMVIDAGRSRDGLRPPSTPSPWLLMIQRLASHMTLLLLAFGLPCGVPAAVAGVGGFAWMIHIAPWQAFRNGGVRFMTFAMAAKRAGFLLLAVDGSMGLQLSSAVAIHVLAIGGLASLAVAIATSIVRKRNGRSFHHSALGTATYACLAAALAWRVAYAFYPEMNSLLHASQTFWLFGFAGYAVLVMQRPEAEPRPALTKSS